MIGAMPAVAVRHERRKNKKADKSNRPNRLLLKPHVSKGQSETLSPCGSHAPSANPSRQGSPTGHGGDLPDGLESGGSVHYGDECFYGKVSLLHFIIFFFLGGLTVLIVGAVQFKKEAGLSNLRYHFLVAGGILVAVGCLLLVIKCACFCIPIPDSEYEDENEDFLNNGEGHKAATTTGKNSSPNEDHNHVREESTPEPPKLSAA